MAKLEVSREKLESADDRIALDRYAPRKQSAGQTAMTTLKLFAAGGAVIGVLWLLDQLIAR